MNRKLPFAGGVFCKVLVVVAILVVVAWWLITWLTDYEITAADYGGSTISTVLLAYLVHLWLLPTGEPPPQETSQQQEASPPDDDSPPEQDAVPGQNSVLEKDALPDGE
ncbi:MAG: hypothetical protein WBE26_09625 [Phycisphaerae bacterium]